MRLLLRFLGFLFAAGTNLWAYWNSDKALLSMYGARPVDERSAPELVHLVQQLSGQAGLPIPKVYIVENDQPNAFATGRDPEHAAVCVTSGLLARVNNEELAGVLAHELGHVKHRDTLTMTIVATVAGAVSMLANFAFFLGGDRRNNPLGLVGMLLVMLFAPLAAVLVQSATVGIVNSRRHFPIATITGMSEPEGMPSSVNLPFSSVVVWTIGVPGSPSVHRVHCTPVGKLPGSALGM